jgi:hypothetical protein
MSTLSGLNKTDKRLLVLASLVLLLALYFLYDDSLLFGDGENDRQPIGSISLLQNDVRKKSAQKFVWKSSKLQERISLGDSIFTGEKSTTEIRFIDGGVLTLGPNSLVVFTDVGGQLQLDLKYGQGELVGSSQFKLIQERPKKKIDLNTLPETIRWVKAPPSQTLPPKKNGLGLQLKWKSFEFHSSYLIQFSQSENFKLNPLEVPSQINSMETRTYPSKDFFYTRVVGFNTLGEPTGVSAITKTSLVETPAPEILTPLANENFPLPLGGDGRPKTTLPLTITWTPSSFEGSLYQLQVSRDPQFKQMLADTQTSLLQHSLTFVEPGSFYARVKLVKAGVPEFWSTVRNFSLNGQEQKKLDSPILLTLKSEGVKPSRKAKFIEWQAVPGAESYILEFSADRQFSQINEIETENEFIGLSEVPVGTYFVRVIASAPEKEESLPSRVGETQVSVAPPTVHQFENFEVLGENEDSLPTPVTTLISWKPILPSPKYEVQISRDPNFSTPQSFITSQTKVEIPLSEPGEYYSRVRALSSSQAPWSQFSPSSTARYQFLNPLGVPRLVEPLNEMTLFFQQTENPNFWLEWKSVKNADSYLIQISQSPGFETVLTELQSEKSRKLLKEVPQGDLYWRVMAKNNLGLESEWSPPSQFKVLSGRTPAGR